MARRLPLVVLLCAAALAHGEIHAVLIGIDKYDNDELTSLRFTVNDVRAFRDLLIDPNVGGAKPENVVLLTPQSAGSQRPTRTNIMVEIKKAALRTAPDDTLIFYFAGHGMETPEGQYLLGVDAQPLLLADTAVPLDRLPAILKDVHAGQVLAIIDACRNDPSAGRAAADNKMGESFARGLRPRLLQPPGAGPKKIATWLACAVGERAWELTDKQHGVFSYWLLEGLQGKAAHDGQVDLAALAGYVTQQVTGWARQNAKTQTPKLDNPDGLQLVLSRPRVGPAPREIPLATLTVTSEPAGAAVQVDGEGKGVTPLRGLLVQLPDGKPKTVQVMLQLPGYQPAAAAVDLEPGKTASWDKPLIKLDLQQPSRPIRTPTPVKPPTGSTPTATKQPPAGPAAASTVRWLPSWQAGPDGLPLILVPSGSFAMGSPAGQGELNERPQRQVSLDDFRIQAIEVTNDAYAKFLNECAHEQYVAVDREGNAIVGSAEAVDPSARGQILLWSSAPDSAIKWHGATQQFTVRPGREDYPVTRVNYLGALVYAQRFGMALPTEAQWERAAQSDEPKAAYPWGSRLVAMNANLAGGAGHDALLPALSLPAGRSFSGALNMLGNVWEWTSDFYLADYHKQTKSYEPRVEQAQSATRVDVTLRGGGYTFPGTMCTIHTRRSANLFLNEPDVGFRCVLLSHPITPVTTTPTQSPAQTGGRSDSRQPTGTKSSGYRLVAHPSLAKLQLAVPTGYELQFTPGTNVGIMTEAGQGDDSQISFLYFPVGAGYTTPEAVMTALRQEVLQVGFRADQAAVRMTKVDTGNPQFELWRLTLNGQMDDEAARATIDVVHAAGHYHGLVCGAWLPSWDKAWKDYQVFLRATIFPLE